MGYKIINMNNKNEIYLSNKRAEKEISSHVIDVLEGGSPTNGKSKYPVIEKPEK